MRAPAILLVLGFLAACHGSEPAPEVSPDLGMYAVLDNGEPTSSDSWTEVSDGRREALQEKLDQAVDDLGLPGAAIAVAFRDSREIWVGASGLANTATLEAWEPSRSFRIGSVTKTFTAAIIFQLVTEGALSLDDSLDQWVPGYFDDKGVTVRHMLSNTSGIVSYNYVGNFDSARPWTPPELVQWAVDNEPELRFEPGTQWEYSNTNFVLLGMVVEAVTDNSYEAEVAARLTEPLGLDDTYVAASGDDNPAIVRCYDATGTDIADTMDPSMGWSAGAIVSTPRDLAIWAVALYGGEVLTSDALTLMLTPTMLADGSAVEYGLGAFIESDGADALYGHTGGIAAFLTYMYFWKTDSIAVVAMSNLWDTELRTLAGYGWSVPLELDFP